MCGIINGNIMCSRSNNDGNKICFWPRNLSASHCISNINLQSSQLFPERYNYRQNNIANYCNNDSSDPDTINCGYNLNGLGLINNIYKGNAN